MSTYIHATPSDGRAWSGSIRGNAAKAVVNHVIDENHSVFDLPGPSQEPSTEGVTRLPICIVGAGCAGLYAAMILDTLGIEYEILESNSRIGGRIFTHRFNGDAGWDAPINDPARYDYIDIGAMRYPNIPFMKRVKDLFERLEMDKDGLLIEYKYSANNTFQLYNDVLYNTADAAVEDIFRVSEAHGGAVPNDYVVKGADKVASEIFEEYKDAFETQPFLEAWKKLTEQDPHSTRGYLLGREYPETVVEWLETFQSATGLYNNSFVESTMDAMDFGSSSAPEQAGKQGALPEYEWYCIDGGSDHLTTRMEKKIQTKPICGARVTKIASTESDEMMVTYTLGGKKMQKAYSQVICTVPLGCLAAIDIPTDDLSYMKRLAIRALNYDTSTKIALRFATRWWEDPSIMPQGRTIKGGISSTDLPIRTCVYPSYGFSATSGPLPGVMLASYTWAQDAQRLGGLAQAVPGSESDQLLVDLTLKNLSALHGVPVEKMGPLQAHFAWNWHADPHARGAFALFGPGQFGQSGEGNSMFASMKAPGAKGKLHIAGEATSAHHAWVLGALNSAWRAVYNALGMYGPIEGKAKRELLKQLWDIPDEEDCEALVKLAALGMCMVL